MTTTAHKNSITLKGSSEIVSEFFYYAVNSILYQRGLYPPEYFSRKQKYGLTVLVSCDEELTAYLKKICSQVEEWLQDLSLQKLVIVVTDVATQEVLERWQFDIDCDKTAKECDDKAPRQKPVEAIKKEIQAVIRQIVATVTFLPVLDGECTFDLLVYTDKESLVPQNWGETGPKFITNSAEVRLKNFNTHIHKVDTVVAYKTCD